MGTFFKNDKFIGYFFGLNSALELEIDDIMLINNRVSFPKQPSKSRLSLGIIEIIALIDRQYWPKTTKTVFITESKLNNLCTCKAPNMFIINANVAYDTFEVVNLKFVVMAKIQSKDNLRKSEKLTF